MYHIIFFKSDLISRKFITKYNFTSLFEEDSELNLRVGGLTKCDFNIDILSGPWSIGHVFSQEMVRLSNLDRARAIGMVQSGTLWHDDALTFGVNKSTITS